MAERKLTELEIERRVDRGHPTSQIARLAAIHLKARYRSAGESWQAFNALSGRFSEASAFTVGAMIGAVVSTTAKAALGGSSDEMDRALANPDWPAIEQVVRVLLSPSSRFLTAPIEASVQVQPQADRKGLQHVPSGPRGAGTRHRASRVMRV